MRAIVRDGNKAFLGSQSLRKLELDKRREVGLIIDDLAVVHGMQKVFEDDWALTPSGRKAGAEDERGNDTHEEAPAEQAALAG